MTRIKTIFWGLLVGITALWIAADPTARRVLPFKQTQNSFINYTGILAMVGMSVALLLALRSTRLEPHIGGLDKSYRLHKWLGIGVLVTALAHWLLIEAPGWLVALGLMAAPPRRGASPRAPQGRGLLHALQGPARSVGEWCLYAAVILIVLALLKKFPYRWFLKTHRFLALVFLVLVFHALVLLKTAYWTQAIAYVLVAFLVAGVLAAFVALFQRVGRTRQAVGQIEAITPHQDGRVLGVSVCIKDRWPGHEAGQFAFVRFDDGEPHPFTISNTWKDDGRLVFLIKGLGDYTRALPKTLRIGSLVTVEGPYGRFTFSGRHERQIWVSAGIGITPFISRMQQLAAQPDGQEIDLFHATAKRDAEEVRRLRTLAQSARVALHVWVSNENGRLTAERIKEQVPDWRSSDVWFCGPVELGDDLRKDFVDAGLSTNAFHQELFHLR